MQEREDEHGDAVRANRHDPRSRRDQQGHDQGDRDAKIEEAPQTAVYVNRVRGYPYDLEDQVEHEQVFVLHPHPEQICLPEVEVGLEEDLAHGRHADEERETPVLPEFRQPALHLGHDRRLLLPSFVIVLGEGEHNRQGRRACKRHRNGVDVVANREIQCGPEHRADDHGDHGYLVGDALECLDFLVRVGGEPFVEVDQRGIDRARCQGLADAVECPGHAHHGETGPEEDDGACGHPRQDGRQVHDLPAVEVGDHATGELEEEHRYGEGRLDEHDLGEVQALVQEQHGQDGVGERLGRYEERGAYVIGNTGSAGQRILLGHASSFV